jgi:ABC-type sugar transport system ATPase subunit
MRGQTVIGCPLITILHDTLINLYAPLFIEFIREWRGKAIMEYAGKANTLLELKGISKRFPGVQALDRVELTLHTGEVLGLIGENGAGKSTLMKIVLGEYQKDEGEMLLKGNPYHPKTPNEALHSGISMIHQELTLVPEMTVAENIWIGRESKFTKMGLIDIKAREKAAIDLLNEWEIDLNPRLNASELSVAHMQLVEIARAVSYDADIIIMDEPTSALTNTEIEKLYRIIKTLAQKGKGIIFISHKLDELFEICDNVVVLRDGQYVKTSSTNTITRDQLITMMVGRELSDLYPKKEVQLGDIIFEVENLSKKGVYENVSFSVRRGEILGFCGLMGAGRTEIMQSIFGIDSPPETGTIKLYGKEIHNKNTKQAIKNGLSMVTEDRLRSGVIHKLSVRENISLAYISKITRFGFIDKTKEAEDCNKIIKAINIKVPSSEQEVGMLSGGNQQKAILGKWLLTQPEVLILDEPTRGIDVGAKAEIYRLIGNLAQSGKAVIVISSELPEIMGVSDRIVVVRKGKIVAEEQRNNFDQETLVKRAFGL